MRWAEIRIETTPEAAELISEILMEQGCRGAAMVGENPVIMTSHLPVDDLLEPRLLKIKARLKEDHSGIQIGPGELTVTFVEERLGQCLETFLQTNAHRKTNRG
jgi:ribosomal protein L11 methylase PrmA